MTDRAIELPKKENVESLRSFFTSWDDFVTTKQMVGSIGHNA